MDFVLFEDERENLINGVNWVDDKLQMPDNAIAFTYFHQSDPEKMSHLKYRIAREISTIGDLQDIEGNAFAEKFFFELMRWNKDGLGYSVYVKDGVPYFHLISGNTVLVKDKQELVSSLSKELSETYDTMKNSPRK